MKIVRAVLCLTMVAVTANTVGKASTNGEDCRPAFAPVSSDAIKVSLDGAEWQIDAVVIGCERQVTGLTERERATIVDILKALVRDRHYHLMAERHRKEFRDEVCRRINRTLRRDVISDIFVFHFSPPGESF